MTYFPEDVFRLIKSFTKPEIWECECCQEEFNKAIDEPQDHEGKFCEDCYEDYFCSCGSCSKEINHFTCDGCEVWCCVECQGFYEAYGNRMYMGYCRECVEREE